MNVIIGIGTILAIFIFGRICMLRFRRKDEDPEHKNCPYCNGDPMTSSICGPTDRSS